MHLTLTTKGRYAVAAMVDLALRSQCGPVALATIAARQHISLSYLEHLFGTLRRHELVHSARGKGGGYSLGRKAEEISVADIIVAVDKRTVAIGCGGKSSCKGDAAGRCATHDLWASLNAKLLEYLDAVSLQTLVDGQLAKGLPIEAASLKRAISPRPVVKPIKLTGPNSVFALGNLFAAEG